MKKTTLYTLAAMVFAIGLATNATAQKDTTEVRIGKKKIIILENRTDKEREKSDLEAGMQAFEDLRDAAAERNAELKLEIIELNSQTAASTDATMRAGLEKQIAEKEKTIAENEKKIDAFESGIAGIDDDLENLSDEIDELDGTSFELADIISPKRKKFNGHWAGFQMGLTNLIIDNNKIGTPESLPFLELTPEKSVGYQVNIFEKNIPVFGQSAGFVTGAGIEWNSFSLAQNVDLEIDDNGKLAGNIIPASERAYEKNRFNMAYLTVPIIFEVQPWGKNSFYVAAGVTGGVRLWSKQKQTYYDNDRKNKYKKRDSFKLNPFRYGATAKIGYKNIAIYANYNASDMFQKGIATEMVQPFTVGVSLMNF